MACDDAVSARHDHLGINRAVGSMVDCCARGQVVYERVCVADGANFPVTLFWFGLHNICGDFSEKSVCVHKKMKCTAAQARVVSAASVPGASVILDAPAGTGKGVTLAAIVRSKATASVGHLSLAATGAAAMHNPCGWLDQKSIPATTVDQKLTPAAARTFWPALARRRWAAFSISIDEYAMLPASTFEALLRLVDEHLPPRYDSRNPTICIFRVAFYLTGDVNQVESVGPGMLRGMAFWQWRKASKPKIFGLSDVLRATNDEFYARLWAALYSFPVDSARIAAVLQERVLRPPAPSNTCRWLTQTNARRHKFNDRHFFSILGVGRDIRALRAQSPTTLRASLEAGGLSSIPAAPSVCSFVTPAGEPIPGGRLAVGMEAVCDKTVLKGDYYEVTKGERFTLVSFGGTPYSNPKRKRSDDFSTFVGDASAWVRAVSLTHPSRGEHEFVAPYAQGRAANGKEEWTCTIAPGAASTIAKSQGQSIACKLVIDVESCKTLGELTTICTRGRDSSMLYVLPFSVTTLDRLVAVPAHKCVKHFNGLTRE